MKLGNDVPSDTGQTIREQDPLKQGLKPGVAVLSIASYPKIREQDPLKQGLKLDYLEACNQVIIIREQDPLKQGLKPIYMPNGLAAGTKFASKIH